ncbi:DASH complex subunit Dad1-domain-containing protein [Dipodascopsis tothii]|uniref:DASH complex subunit Dad1-domain-containing protein n=1 Tax=Dipodascopsis tothii TaxID=44089 RepID=UPI0034CFABC3
MVGRKSAREFSTRNTMDAQDPDRTYFVRQRDALVSEISLSLEQVLTNLNTLNRSLETMITVGKEFESVSSLWSSFYDTLNKPEETEE